MSDQHFEKITEHLHSIDKTLIKQEENLKEHMRRSAANEKAVAILAEEIKPIQAHVIRVDGVFKFLGLLALIITIFTGIYRAVAP